MLFLYLMSANPDKEITENSFEKLVCESCGEDFSCGSKIGKCWCFAVEVNAETLADIKTKYKECLCEKCLTELRQKAE
jgi:hypothetical protein